MLSTDFWWLSSEEAKRYGYIDLFHQEPYSDEPDPARGPCSCPMERGERRYPLKFINRWRVKFRNINVFRSLALYSSGINSEELIGPFLLDIDRTSDDYVPDLGKALEATRLLVRGYCSSLSAEDYRVFFTGHKGFHVEINPRAIKPPPNVGRLQHFENRRKYINQLFGSTFIDKFHPHVRLHNSINSWIDYSGKRVYSMNFEVDIDGLFDLSAEQIFAKARNLALGALKP